MLPGQAAGGVPTQAPHAPGEGGSGPGEAITSMHMYPWMAGSFPGAKPRPLLLGCKTQASRFFVTMLRLAGSNTALHMMTAHGKHPILWDAGEHPALSEDRISRVSV